MALAQSESFVVAVVLLIFFVVWVRAVVFLRAACSGEWETAETHLGPRPDFSNVTWPASFLALVVTTYVALLVASGLIAGIVIDVRGPGTAALTIQAIVNGVTCVFAVRFVRRGFAAPLTAVGLGKPFDRFTALFALCGYASFVPLMLLAAIASKWLYLQWGEEAPTQDVLDVLARVDGVASFAWLALLTVVVIPITEEILFRGFLFSTLRRRFGSVAAIVASSALFAILHDTSVMLPVFVIGLCLAILYDRTQSIVACAAAHIIHNGVQVLLYVLARR